MCYPNIFTFRNKLFINLFKIKNHIIPSIFTQMLLYIFSATKNEPKDIFESITPKNKFKSIENFKNSIDFFSQTDFESFTFKSKIESVGEVDKILGPFSHNKSLPFQQNSTSSYGVSAYTTAMEPDSNRESILQCYGRHTGNSKITCIHDDNNANIDIFDNSLGREELTETVKSGYTTRSSIKQQYFVMATTQIQQTSRK